LRTAFFSGPAPEWKIVVELWRSEVDAGRELILEKVVLGSAKRSVMGERELIPDVAVPVLRWQFTRWLRKGGRKLAFRMWRRSRGNYDHRGGVFFAMGILIVEDADAFGSSKRSLGAGGELILRPFFLLSRVNAV
jgi:hypothetical protein